MNNFPNWKNYNKDHNKWFAPEFSHISIPGYIDNKEYPFTYNYSLTHGSNKFSASDGPTELIKNLKIKPLDWKYRTKEIYYEVNSNGYRTKEWDQINWKEAIVLFGCSCTFGLGLAEDETISYHLSKLTGREVVNLGFSSGSNELIVNNCAAMIKRYGMPYGVVINWTTTDRFRFYSADIYHDLGPWNAEKNDRNDLSNEYLDIQKFWKDTFVDPSNELAKNYYWSTYADAMFEGRTKYLKISFFGLAAYYTRSDKFFTIDNKARDGIHPGEANSIEVAEFIYNKFKDE